MSQGNRRKGVGGTWQGIVTGYKGGKISCRTG